MSKQLLGRVRLSTRDIPGYVDASAKKAKKKTHKCFPPKPPLLCMEPSSRHLDCRHKGECLEALLPRGGFAVAFVLETGTHACVSHFLGEDGGFWAPESASLDRTTSGAETPRFEIWGRNSLRRGLAVHFLLTCGSLGRAFRTPARTVRVLAVSSRGPGCDSRRWRRDD